MVMMMILTFYFESRYRFTRLIETSNDPSITRFLVLQFFFKSIMSEKEIA